MSIKNIFINMKGIIKIKLREGLLGEGVIEIPKEIVNKFGVLYDLIKSNIDEYKEKSLNKTIKNPIIAFNNFFKLKDKANKPLSINVGFYNDPKDIGLGRMNTYTDTVLINLAKFDYDSKFFEYILYHELVHAMDPLVRDIHMFNKYMGKKGAEPSGNKFALIKNKDASGNLTYSSEKDKNTEKYMKSQHEYTAFLSNIASDVKRIFGNDKNKQEWLRWFIENIGKFKNYNEMYDGVVKYLDKMKEVKLFNNEKDLIYFIHKLFDAKKWVSDPKIYKKFIKDIYSSLEK